MQSKVCGLNKNEIEIIAQEAASGRPISFALISSTEMQISSLDWAELG